MLGTPPPEMLQSSQGSIPNAQTLRESHKHNHKTGKEKRTNMTAATAIMADPENTNALGMSAMKSEESIAKLG